MGLALLGALVIGLSLGLLGSGGSILTVPTLVFVVGQDEKLAIAGSLAIVGIISAGAAVQNAFRGRVRWRSVALFAPPGMAGTYLGAWLSRYISGETQLVFFAGVMFLVAFLMLRPEREGTAGPTRAFWKIAIDGLIVGIVTGLVGVGGGFLIIPALVLLGGLQMKDAVGTSLVIIALKSAAGFWKYLAVLEELHLEIDWQLVGIFSSVGLAGSICGNLISAKIPQAALRRAFGCLLVVMAAYILWTHIPGKSANTASEPAPESAAEQSAEESETLTPGEVRWWGAMREVLRQGRTEGRIALSEVSGRDDVVAVGALAGLVGEITVADGRVWIGRAAAGDEADSEESDVARVGDAEATLLVAARVPTWNSSAVTTDLSPGSLDAFVRGAAVAAGLDVAHPFPFVIEGEMFDLHFHVVNGGCPMVADLPPERAPRRIEAATTHGTLVGFHAEDAHGVLTHHGTSSHVHVLVPDGTPPTGHVDSVGVRAGATLKLPAAWPIPAGSRDEHVLQVEGDR